ncbi:MAG: DEAD/DEAH box helicase [Vallitaleaceae bacterium]|nr:DEAD/DEAH box helicase [Vallitaleaceae bacterium]
MQDFKSLNIREQFITALEKQAITIPTTIQMSAIGPALENKDLIAEAVTGSGKTLAYVLPAFERIDVNSNDLHTLILAPTHELVVQISSVIRDFAKASDYPIRTVSIMGNVNIKRQLDNLKNKPHIIVGTTGRVHELIKLKKIKAHLVKTIVIDEADKLLSPHSIQGVMAVIKTTLRERQILAFSASISKDAIEKASSFMKDPIIIRLAKEKINTAIEHIYVTSTRRDKINVLRKVIHATKPTKAIVFLNKNELIQEVTDRLNYHKITSVCIFGNASKSDRKKALDAFKGDKATIIVASDLVARGLDLQGMSHVINMDIPGDLNEYIHRVGRTGRAGEKGTAISIITDNEKQFLKKIEKINGITIEPRELQEGHLVAFKNA